MHFSFDTGCRMRHRSYGNLAAWARALNIFALYLAEDSSAV